MMRRDCSSIDPYAFEAWFKTSFGAAFVELEKRELRAIFPHLLGSYLLQVGVWGWDETFLATAALPHQWTLGLNNGPKAPAVSASAALPVPTRSMDAVVIPHGLEFVAQPDRLLAEVNRTLSDRGQVVILGFNPISLAGIQHWIPGRGRYFPWLGRPLGLMRVKACLDNFDLEVGHVRRFGVRLPRLSGEESRRLTPKRLCAPLGGAYLIVARKRVVPLTPRAKPVVATPKLKPVVAPPVGTGCAARVPHHRTRCEEVETAVR